MSLFFLYRLNGGEVLSVSTSSLAPYSAYFSEIQDPGQPDGSNLVPPKIRLAGDVVNATQEQIDNFAVAAAEDDLAALVVHHKDAISDPTLGQPSTRGILSVLVDRINELRVIGLLDPITLADQVEDLETYLDSL